MPSSAKTTSTPCWAVKWRCDSLNSYIDALIGNHSVAYHWVDVDDVFKALADPSRRMLLDRLQKRNGQTLGELCEAMAMSRQAVTKHLDILEAANLVATRRRGRKKLHYLNVAPIADIYDRWIGKFERARVEALQTLRQSLEDSSHA